jgi:hypothetical protein
MKRSAILILFFISLLSCEKKYEDGPCISFIKPENRVNGRWKIDDVLVNGEQSPLADNDSLIICSFSFFRNTDNTMFVSLLDSSNIVWAESLVRTDSRMIYLSFNLSTIEGFDEAVKPVFHILPPLANENTWQITRLKRKEMWMRTVYSEVVYELKFQLLFDYENL